MSYTYEVGQRVAVVIGTDLGTGTVTCQPMRDHSWYVVDVDGEGEWYVEPREIIKTFPPTSQPTPATCPVDRSVRRHATLPVHSTGSVA